MDNPYWKTKGRTHQTDIAGVKRLCFALLNIVEAGQSLASQFEAGDPEEPAGMASRSSLLALHRELAEEETSRLLLQLAMMIRTYDDVMSASRRAKAYLAYAEATSGIDYIGTLSDSERFDLREACNKIIHAAEIRALYERVDQESPSEGGEARPDLWYPTGEIELSGRRGKKNWDAVLYVQPFIETALDRIAFSARKPRARAKG